MHLPMQIIESHNKSPRDSDMCREERRQIVICAYTLEKVTADGGVKL